MEQTYLAVRDNPLFKNIGEADFNTVLSCVQARTARYAKGAAILLAGDAVDTVGLVVSGSVQIVREDSEGKQNLMAELPRGELFGEVFACAGVRASPVTVLAAQPTQVLHLNYRRVITACPSACGFHHRLIENMLALLAQKNLLLNQKIELLSKRTIRQRVLLYLQLAGHGQQQFEVPYGREALAAYLCVDRSALSAELSKMQREGLIRFSHNRFTLL